MKKGKLLSTIALATILLAACQSQQKTEETTTVEETTTTTTAVSTTEEVKPDYTLYDAVIQKYAKVQPGSSTGSEDINYMASLARPGGTFTGIEYAQVDLDKNGIDELLIAFRTKDNKWSLINLYTLNKDQLVRMTTKENGLDAIGERTSIVPLKDGTFAFHASGGARNSTLGQFQIDKSGLRLEKNKSDLSAEEFQKLGEALDLSTVGFKSVKGNNAPVAEKKGIDIEAIKNGDYSSLAGTWKNNKGQTYTFDANGLVGDYEIVGNAREVNGFVMVGAKVKSAMAGGFNMIFIQANSPFIFNGIQDPSDSSKDRIMVGQAYQGETDCFFYKVSE
ncbi:DUF6287 domain-containing protein [uncultured Granulicatella sp.]|uniref:DUF6287 domain-containing protein n=1 Tax=uncultured Granulicatella sp. TaxID=316089 RepID=UPI00260FA2B3|nr:DUF6287 domain-containing protein [uncultured Granulicatella sp.]